MVPCWVWSPGKIGDEFTDMGVTVTEDRIESAGTEDVTRREMIEQGAQGSTRGMATYRGNRKEKSQKQQVGGKTREHSYGSHKKRV